MVTAHGQALSSLLTYIRLLELVVMQMQFFALYTQMYPQHSTSHRDHENSLYHVIQQCKPIAHILEYDDYVRKHCIEKIGEAWISTDPSFTCMTSLLLTMTKFENDKIQKKLSQNHNHHPKHKSSWPPTKSKPKATGAGVCYAYNRMSKNSATCNHANCSYPHRCTNCKGPHTKPECDKLK